MSLSWKPKENSIVSPYLIVSNVKNLIDFLKKTFNATILRSFGDDEEIVHAEVQVFDTTVMIGSANNNWSETVCHLNVYVPDLDSIYLQALEAGGLSVQEPTKRNGDPNRRGGIKDPAGNTWWIATFEE